MPGRFAPDASSSEPATTPSEVAEPATAPSEVAEPATMARLFSRRAGDERTGLAFGERRWSWAEVVDEAAARAAVLRQMLEPGAPHVAVLLDNVPEYHFWLAACALAGGVVVGANPTHRGSELARDLSHTRCQLLVTDLSHRPLVEGLHLGDAIGSVDSGNERVLEIESERYRSLVAAAGGAPTPDPSPIEESTLGYLIFTSGTSGVPKACRCSQGRLARISLVVPQMFGLGPDDVCLVAMPLFHSNALMAGWGPAVAAGATVALPSTGRFSASGFLPDVRRYAVTYFNYVGKPLSYVLATEERADDADNPLRTVFGNEGSERDIQRFARRFGCSVVDAYGSTEGAAVVARTPDTPPGALGRAPEGTMVVDPDTGAECPPARFDTCGRLLNADEATGELVSTTGGAGFEGYWDNEEAEDARLRHGWYWTGDLAYRDEAGFFYFAGRSGDWLRVDGENFAAAPVARILERHPAVRLAAVYAVPDPKVGDQVMAAVELVEQARFDPQEFSAFLAAQPDLGTKWAPRLLRVCSRLPTTATSKVLVRRLRAEAWRCTDPVWWTPDGPAGSTYRRLEPGDLARLAPSSLPGPVSHGPGDTAHPRR
ncbi:MAG TPA: long-chain-fatty-acid--CoA ligase [Acidimicrobiales bacterium]|nr:long-chain-fatty-acid--CoA ligase [Acidimicrobiales bacterium]